MKLLIMFLLISMVVQAQTTKIVKVLDSNLFELQDGRIVKLAGIDVPKLSHPSSFFQSAAKDAIEYANINLLDKFVEVYSVPQKYDKIFELVTIYKNYLFNRVNINERYLSLGFGKYLNNTNEDLSRELINTEREAIQEGVGIWYYGKKLTDNDTLDADLSNCFKDVYSILFFGSKYQIKRPTPIYFAIPLQILTGSGVTFISALGSGFLLMALTWSGYGFILGAYYGIIVGYLIGFPSGVYLVAKDINPDLSYLETLGFSLGVTGLTAGLSYLLFRKENNHPTTYLAILSPVIGSILYANFLAPKISSVQKTTELGMTRIKTHKDFYNSRLGI